MSNQADQNTASPAAASPTPAPPPPPPSLKPYPASTSTQLPAYTLGQTTFRQAKDSETHAALKLILAIDDSPADEGRIVEFLRYAMARKLDLTQIVIAENKQKITWAVLPVPSGGRSLLILTPPTPPATDTGPADAAELIRTALARHPHSHIAQALLDPDDAAGTVPFLDAGFEKLAVLQYLDRDISSPPIPVVLPKDLSVVSYNGATHHHFHAALEASYINSLDCPALNGRRNIDDVLEGHKSSGDFRPDLWRVLLHASPAGQHVAAILLLNPTGNGETMELVYLGVAPPFRGQGLGAWAVRTAITETYQAGLPKLTLAVDSGNRPALRLYHRFGFKNVHERLVLLREINTTPR